MSTTLRSTRSDNRLPLVLDAAARLFRGKGYHATSMRDIAADVGMLAGSIYYHFPAKEDLLIAVYEFGVHRFVEAAEAAAASHRSPWKRLEAACVAHLEALLGGSDYAQVVIRVLPDDVPHVRDQLVCLRDTYDRVFEKLVAELPLQRGVDRHWLRLMLFGALNWAQTWYRPGGEDDPRTIATRLVALLRYAEAPPPGGRAAQQSGHP